MRSSGLRASSTDSIDVRASFRSCRRCSSLSTIDQHQVTGVAHQARPLPDDEHQVVLMNRISSGDDSADDGEIPEKEWNVTLALPFRGDPLNDEAGSEDDLAQETESEPGAVERHAS